MRHFNYYLFDNYDASQINHPLDDPRNILNEDIDIVLSAIVDSLPSTFTYNELCTKFTQETIDTLIHIGLFRTENSFIYLDAPVFLHEDIPYLQHGFDSFINTMSNNIIEHKEKYNEIVAKLNNEFSNQINLYHLLCGYVLDGSFFDFLCHQNIISTSRIHPSNLDYLIIIYEKNDELDKFAEQLLCSYNRFTDGNTTLQSFGDANGNRVDFFRFANLKRLRKVPTNLKHIELLWDSIKQPKKEYILQELRKLILQGQCDELFLNLFSSFEYVKDNKIIVPIYTNKDKPILEALEHLTEECIGYSMIEAITAVSTQSLICSKHGVNNKEIANELYHILFGQLNEKLVERQMVATPIYKEKEGCYLKSITLDI